MSPTYVSCHKHLNLRYHDCALTHARVAFFLRAPGGGRGRGGREEQEKDEDFYSQLKLLNEEAQRGRRRNFFFQLINQKRSIEKFHQTSLLREEDNPPSRSAGAEETQELWCVTPGALTSERQGEHVKLWGEEKALSKMPRTHKVCTNVLCNLAKLNPHHPMPPNQPSRYV